MDKIKVLGTSAYSGSGQDTLADAIAKTFGIQKYSSGDVLRNYAKKKGLAQTREVLQGIRVEWDAMYGRMYMPEILSQEIVKSNKSAIITGIRTIEEYDCYANNFEYTHLFVSADIDLRISRILKRAEEKDPITEDEFKKQSLREMELFDLPALKCRSHIEYLFNMPMEEFKKSYVDVIKSLQLNKYLNIEARG